MLVTVCSKHLRLVLAAVLDMGRASLSCCVTLEMRSYQLYVLRGAFKFYGLPKKRLLRPCNRGVSVVKNVYVYRVITLRNDCIFSFLW